MKKISLICLALVLALGSLGVGYAMWSDTVTISGTVNTGSVDIDITGVSHTYVYKVVDDIVGGNLDGKVDGDIIFSPCVLALEQDAVPDGINDLLLVASAVTTDTSVAATDVDSVSIAFDKVFPTATANISGDVEMKYLGTIPAHVELTALTYSSTIGADLQSYLNVEWFSKPDGTAVWVKVASPTLLQLHENDMMKVVINFDLPQDNALQSATGTISGSILVKQWNK